MFFIHDCKQKGFLKKLSADYFQYVHRRRQIYIFVVRNEKLRNDGLRKDQGFTSVRIKVCVHCGYSAIGANPS